MFNNDDHNSKPLTALTLPASCGSTEQRAKIFAALADPTRLRIVERLAQADGEMRGSDLAGQVGISLALFCHHSKTLGEAGVIQTRKEGQTKYHSLNRGLLGNCFASLNSSGRAGF